MSAPGRSGTVSAMATPRSRQAARLRARRRRAQQRARLVALLVALGLLGLVTLLLTAFGSGGASSPTAPPASASPAPARPTPVVLASVGNLRVQLPVAASAVTAIGFHASPGPALALTPLGRQANEGLLARLWRRIAGQEKRGLAWYQVAGGAGTEVLDVGAAAGTDAFAPVDGTVAAISDQVLNGRVVGARIDIRPTQAPSLVLSIENLERDPALTVGAPVLASTSKLGTVADISSVERQALARYSRDSGDNVSIQVVAAASSLP